MAKSNVSGVSNADPYEKYTADTSTVGVTAASVGSTPVAGKASGITDGGPSKTAQAPAKAVGRHKAP